MFWCKTISGNDFTLHCVFGCAWKIKFSGKTFQLTVCFMALTWKLVYISIFITNHFRVSDTQRERERERVPDPPKTDRTPASAPPSRSNHHRDFTPDQSHPIKIASPSKTDPPKTDLIGTVVTHDQSHHPLIVTDDQSRCPLDLVLISSLPMTDLVAHEP